MCRQECQALWLRVQCRHAFESGLVILMPSFSLEKPYIKLAALSGRVRGVRHESLPLVSWVCVQGIPPLPGIPRGQSRLQVFW